VKAHANHESSAFGNARFAHAPEQWRVQRFYTTGRFIKLACRELLTRSRVKCCDECLRPIRGWHRHLWLNDPERCVHLRCWKARLFVKALVADHMRSAQVRADEYSGSPQNHSRENESRELHQPSEQHDQTESLVIISHPTEQPLAKARIAECRFSGNSPIRGAAPQYLQDFLRRLTNLRRSPPPLRLCMLCGAAEYTEKSVFCSKCGTFMRPSS
jgi:hypothetical protein